MTCFRSLIAGMALSLTMLAPAVAQMPQPPEIAARAYVLLDVTTGQVLASKDPDAPVEPASLTKLMSAYLVFDALRAGKITLTQTFGVSEPGKHRAHACSSSRACRFLSRTSSRA